jgi:hypothetical protein
LSGHDLVDFAARFGPRAAEAVTDGRLDALRDRPKRLWFIRTPSMADIDGNSPPYIATHVTALVEILTACPPCLLACSPAACACPSREAS